MRVLTPALVNKGLLEMAQLVKVGAPNCSKSALLSPLQIIILAKSNQGIACTLEHYDLELCQLRSCVGITTYSTITHNNIFLFRQIWMSALQIPVLVTRTRTVPTMTVLIAALANKGLMEMVQLVKVCACRTANENTMLALNHV